MNLKLKATALLLVLAMAGPLLSGCSTATTGEDGGQTAQTPAAETQETVPEEEDTYVYDDLPSPDYNGYGFRILSCNFYNKELATYITFDEVTGDPVNDVLFNSKNYIEDRFNVGISWIETGDTGALETVVRTTVKGGDNSYEIFIGHDAGTCNLGKEGLLFNLFDVEQFNFDKPWWPKKTVEAFRMGNKMFTASSYLSYCGLHWTRVITVNKDYADEIRMEVPYNDVREGTWTLDKLYSLTEGNSQDLDGNGKINTRDKVAFTSGSQTWYCMQEAVDIPVYRHDSEGIPYLDLDLDRTQKYVEIMRKLIRGDDYMASGDFGIELFEKGNALFAYTQVGDAYDYYRISDVRYGFLPTPKLDELQSDYINCCTDVPWGIPKTITEDQGDLVGTIVEAMSCYNYNYVLPAYYEVAIKARAADAPEDTEMLTIIADTRTISFAYTYSLSFNNIVSNCVENNQEVASFFKSGEKGATKTLAKLVEKYENMD